MSSNLPLILVVDDDIVSLTIASTALKKKGYPIITAADGQQALDQCINQHPQIILMDGEMPILNGFDACRQIKSHPEPEIHSTPVIMVTALEDNNAIDNAFAAGAEDYITKPVNWRILEHRLDLLIKKNIAEKALRENEERFQAIAESAIDAIISINHHGKIVFWNHAASQLFGYKNEEIIGKDLEILIPEELRATQKKGFVFANQSDISQISRKARQLEGLRKNGESFQLELTLSAWTSNNERFYSCILRDITERLKNEDELNKLSMAVKQSPNLVIITDSRGIIEYVNPKITSLTGYSADEVIGQKTNIFHSGNTANNVYHDLWSTIQHGKIWQGSIQNRKKTGELYWAKESISPITNDEGLITHFIAIQEDETTNKKLTEEIAYRAAHDPLTGLINRHEFEIHLSLLIKESKSDDIHALCFIDLDRFKIVNDTAGHPAGDELLRQLGRQMKKAGRKQDMLARLGGDEFALLLAYCNQEQALHIAEKLHQIINQYQLNWNNQIFKVGASIGVVTIDKNDDTNNILKYADIACYTAKNSGRNQVYLFNNAAKNTSLQADKSQQWLTKIQDGLEYNHFLIYIQPIVALNDKKLGQFGEILIRFQENDGRIITPEHFLSAAERYNLLADIDYWVMEQTMAWFTTHPTQLDQYSHISINLSAHTLTNPIELISDINDLLQKYQFPAHKLVFEIAEMIAINNLTQVNELIHELHDQGVKFSLDNFGSGMSALSYLKNLPVDYLKIDGIFIRDIKRNSTDLAMVRSIHQVAKAMNKKTIAERVEDEKTALAVSELGIDYAQGYYYQKPLSLEDL